MGRATVPTRADWLSWLDAMASVVALPIRLEDREGVAAQLELNRRLIGPLLEFEVPAGAPGDTGSG